MSEQRPNFAAMTLNERLYEAGSLSEFVAAITSRDRDRAIAILKDVEVSDDGPTQTVDTVLENPSKYGYPDPT